MDDLISRQAAIDAMNTWDKFGCDPDGRLVRFDDNKHYVPYVRYDDMVYVIKSLPSAQPEPAIPISWIEEKIERLENRKNSFAVLDAMQLKALIKRWVSEQNETN